MENEFGLALLELIDEEYPTAEDALNDIYEQTGIEPDDVLNLIEGSSVPDADATSALIEVFDSTSSDPEAAQGLLILAEEAFTSALDYNESLDEDEDEDEEYEDEDEEYEDEDEDEEDEELEATSRYSRYSRNFNNIGILGDIQEVQQELAEFKAANDINSVLDELEDYAQQGISEGWLSPGIKNLVMGNFAKDSQRLAKFSAVCEDNGVDAATQLFGINYTLQILEQLGPLDLLNDYTEEDVENAQFSASEEQTLALLARGALDLYKQNKL